MSLHDILRIAEEKEIDLSADDVEDDGTIDGMPAAEWLESMVSD